METKDRTQASYNLVDINEQARIAFEKCKGTKEQKIERLKAKLKKEKWWYNQWNKIKVSSVSGCMKWQIKQTIVT